MDRNGRSRAPLKSRAHTELMRFTRSLRLRAADVLDGVKDALSEAEAERTQGFADGMIEAVNAVEEWARKNLYQTPG